ncbi:sulfite exporter TauE/SafE family protein [Trichothermofontia sp.]
MLIWIVGHLLAAGIGLSLGLIGGGGSVLALPILVYVMGVPPKSAIAMTLVIVGSVSLLALIPHAQRGQVNVKKALLFGSATMLGAFLGARLALLPWVTETFQMLLFAVMMGLAAVFMIRKTAKAGPVPPTAIPGGDLSLYPQPVCKYCWLWMLTEGLGVGVLTGLVGVGGGFAIVPALVLLGNTPMREAIGTSLLIIALNSVAGFLGYVGQVPLDWGLILSFTIAAGAGTLIGGQLSGRVKPQHLQKGFGYFLLAMAAFILVQNREALRPRSSEQPHSIPVLAQKNLKLR